MEAVLGALAPPLKQLITDMAREEVSMLLGVPGEITKLNDNMEGIKAFLADAERRRLTDQSVQRWVRKLKDAMYDATDIIDLCQLELDERKVSIEGGSSVKEKVPAAGCFQRLLFCLRNPVFAHKVGSQIKELNKRLEDIHKEARNFKFNIYLGSDPEPRRLTDAERSMQKMTSEFDESAIVGEKIEQDTRELSQLLITGANHDIKVLSIVGAGGMGKTTLSQKIFKDTTTVKEHFKVKVWLSITQYFDETQMLKTAIEHAGGVHGGTQDKTLLTRTLTNTLSTGRFLLVLDDMWSEDAWSHVLSVPVRNASLNQSGNWVLITTRFGDLAQRMGASFYQHHVKPLDVEDAWSLLKKQLPPNQVVGIDDRLKDIGTEILKKCEGLPLAIKVVGGLLSTRYPSEREWNVVLSSPAWSVAGLPKELDNRIYLSYEDLSPQLKQCFLYCSLFPKGEVIIQTVVTDMWISEGFILPPDESSSHEHGLEEIATEYYRELIKRNLIEPTKEYPITGYGCTMHDVVRSFAEYMAREESAVVVDNKQVATCGAMLIRRLSVGQTVSVVEWYTLQRMKSLRTLIINSSIKFQSGGDSLLGSFSSLRVLYIWSADRLVASLSNLNHLRYLHLEGTNVSRMPDDIQQMKFLQFIRFMNCKKLAHLPSSIVKLVHLRSLNITGSNVSVVPKGFGGLTNLRLLYGFPVHMDSMDHAGGGSWCSLQELAPLSQLRQLTLHGLEKVPTSRMAEKALISSKGHLSYLVFNYSSDGGGGVEQQRQQSVIQEEVLEKLCPPTSCLENLIVKGGYAGRKLPSWMHAPTSAVDFKSLRFFRLENLPYCTRLPEGLCCLPCLELLTIKDAPTVKRIGPEFQAPSSLPAGDTVVVALAQPPFPKLRVLQLIGLCKWEDWEWNNDEGCDAEQQGSAIDTIAMPCLEKLTIDKCKLSHLPPGLASMKRHALRELNLYNLTNLTYVENFPSVMELDVFDCPELRRISRLSRLHKIRIVRCPKLEVLEGVPSLDSLVLQDATLEVVPGYLQGVNPRYLKLKCSKKLCKSLLSPGSSEQKKINHIGKLNIIGKED